MFDIPIGIFIFKREKAVEIIKRIAQIKPRRLYILADHGRNEEEKKQAEKCRRLVEESIDWECEVIKNYANENRGVYENIAEGAKWVLKQEKWAIFLEDDNLPEITFFEFCREMLYRYENDTRIVWVCGTNYLGEYHEPQGNSYVFTRHMLPCGWASWSSKFLQFYDGMLEHVGDDRVMSNIGDVYWNSKVYKQYRKEWLKEHELISKGVRPSSWDYQMDFSLKAHNLFGICPCRNQIRNIGVDNDSAHGGNSYDLLMTQRFCGMESYPLVFPLKHPTTVLQDRYFEEKIAKIILIPLSYRVKTGVKRVIVSIIKSILRIPKDVRLREYFIGRRGVNK